MLFERFGQKKEKKEALKRAEGFTLVELIVVIAILAILSAVGVSAYGAYIEKANQSADEQAAANVSYAIKLGAVADQVADEDDWGYVMLTTEGVEVSMDSSEHNEQVSGWLSDALGSDYATAIVIKSSEYSEDGIAIYAPSGKGSDNSKWTAASAAFQSSNYYGNEESLVETVGALTTAFSTLVTSTESLANLLATMAGQTDNTEMLEMLYETYGLTEDSDAATVANAMVAYMADSLADADVDGINSLVNGYVSGTTSYDDLMTGLSDYTGGSLQTLTLLFGIATAYGNSDYVDTTGYFYTMFSDISTYVYDDDSLDAYIEAFMSDSGVYYYLIAEDDGSAADVSGFIAAMSVLSDAVANGDFDLTDADAFSSSDTLAYMLEVLGY